MKTILTLASIIFAAASTLQAQDNAAADDNRPAARLFAMVQNEADMIETAMSTFAPMFDQMRAQGVPGGAIDEIRAASLEFMTSVITDPAFKKGAIELYERTFDADELEELIAFYSTPLGQKTLRRMPVIMQDSMALGQKIAGQRQRDFQDRVNEIVTRHQPEGESE